MVGMYSRAGKRHRKPEEAFTLIELAVVILILAILVAIAVPVYLNVTHQADRRVAQYNIKAAEEVHNRIWFDLMERNNFPDGTGSYTDANPPSEVGTVGPSGYMIVDAEYFSKLETRIPWVEMTATGSLVAQSGMFASVSPEVDVLAQVDQSFDFDITGLYRGGEMVVTGEEMGDDLGGIPGRIAVLHETVFLNYTWCTNPENKYISMMVMEKSGRTYILTFCQGQLVKTYYLSYDPGSGGFNFPTGPADVSDTMKFTPSTLNIDSDGSFTCSYEVDIGSWWGFDESCFDIGSVVCGNAHAVDIKVNENGKVLIKFDREDLVGLEPGQNVPISINGSYTSGQSFSGTSTVKVVENHGKK